MSDKRITLETAAFLDWVRAEARAGGRADRDLQSVARRFLECAYQDLGKAPKLFDGDDLEAILTEVLPRRFGVKDPLASEVVPILESYFEHLGETTMVVHAFEVRQAFATHGPTFAELVRSGRANAASLPARKAPTVKHRAEKVGRNDPCPCGSEKKFKKCCGKLG